MERITSPLTGADNTEFVKKINKNEIIRGYKKYNINTSSYFKNINTISVYKCLDTGYQFFYPFNLSGDSSFYEHFQKFNWYYMPWKWEHNITKQYLNNNMNLLEVGCAQGAFLSKISELFDFKTLVGLELNESSPVVHDNWSILNQTVQDFSKKNKEKFDLVCSYQVLEHIADVRSFIEAKIKCLKKGGKLIISVPNNDSYIKFSDNCLNMPPHHMGLWTEESLKSLTKQFPLELVEVHYEDLQDYHLEHYVSATYYYKYRWRILKKIIRKINKVLGIHQKLINKINKNRQDYIGQTILVVLEKK